MAYVDRSHIEARFGKSNVAKWADLDSDGNETDITARVTLSITTAQAQVDDRLRNGPLTIPFTEPPPQAIIDITATLAAVWLYESRGTMDSDPETGKPRHRLAYVREQAMRQLRDIHSNRLVLDLDTPTTVPEVVKL